MIWIFIIAMIGLAVLFYKLDDDLTGIWFGTMIISLLISAALFVVAIVGTCCVVDAVTIDERIEMYQFENQKIEEQIAELVEKYQEYEQSVFNDVSAENVIALVTLYPELKSDSLVQKQMDVYIENSEKIKELKEDKITAKPIKWWLYFGG